MTKTDSEMAGKYHSFEWKELPPPAKDAVQLLGVTPDEWNKTRTVNKAGGNKKVAWQELDQPQQTAAAVLGYDNKTWDSDDPLNVHRREVENNPTRQTQ